MKKSDIKTIKNIIARFETFVSEIESIEEKQKHELQNMNSRTKMLNNKEIEIEKELSCLDIARVEILSAIEDLSKSIE